MGRHVVCLPVKLLIATPKYGAILQGLHVLAICMIKMSVCFALLRLVDRARRRLTQFLWILLGFIVVTHLALAMVLIFHCRRYAALWDFGRKGSCVSAYTVYFITYVGFAIDIMTDFICAIIPLFVINKLQMKKRTKFCLCILMGLGVFTAACAAAKMATLNGSLSIDATYAFMVPALWGAVEQMVGIIITSAPVLPSVYTSACDRWRKHASPSNQVKKNTSWLRLFRGKTPSPGSQQLRYSSPQERMQEKPRTHMFWYRSRDDNDTVTGGIERQTVITTETEERPGGSSCPETETESPLPDPRESPTRNHHLESEEQANHLQV